MRGLTPEELAILCDEDQFAPCVCEPGAEGRDWTPEEYALVDRLVERGLLRLYDCRLQDAAHAERTPDAFLLLSIYRMKEVA